MQLTDRLRAINHQFYTEFAEHFSQTRHQINPGIGQAFSMLAAEDKASFLDVGCGDGRVGRYWLGLPQAQPTRRTYVGLDGSAALLAVGQQQFAAQPTQHHWQLLERDFGQTDWGVGLPAFELLGCFAALHHLPRPMHRPFLQQLRLCAQPAALAIVSVWQFAHLARFLNKRVDWAAVGLDASQLSERDYLLDWRQGGNGLRYVYHFDAQELAADCLASGWQVLAQFRSDGASNDLGLYTVLRAAEYPLPQP